MPDPDLEIRGGGSSRPLDKGERVVEKKSAFQASVWSKNKGGPGPFSGSGAVMTENNSGPICFKGMISVFGFPYRGFSYH